VRRLVFIVAVIALAGPAVAHARTNPQIAGLQVALRAHGLYLGPIDGIAGPRTAAAIHKFQKKKRLHLGVADAHTRAALGPLGRPLFGTRALRRGDFGWDVAVLQFLLTRRAVYSGALDGYFGAETAAGLARYQRQLKLSADAVVGPRTLSAIVRRDRVPIRTHVTVPVGVYHVRAGDTLTAIAQHRGTTVTRLAHLNKIDPAKPIVVGQLLHLPAVTAAPSLAPQGIDVRNLLDDWSGRLGVDPHLVRALAWMESGYQTRIVSQAGARGVLQTLPSTRDYVETVLLGRRAPMTVSGDVEVGVAYLKHLLEAFDGNERLALAGWYQGERAVRKDGPYEVTKPFVADVLALKSRM
jgi:nucleoid-associated protein YgaU